MPGRSWRPNLALALVLAAACAIPGCGDDEPATQAGETTTAPSADGSDSASTAPLPTGPEARAAHCPPELENCATAAGTIIYIERVDPDGDGDAHFVLSSEEGITFKGVSVIDVSAELRPHPLPKFGDHVSAAGPVYRGSYDQRQIEAIELNVAE